ncbi:hypothetical protein [Enterococcus sp.]|uniref:hypothetical protein n=1 Tax=Enterococcus sp. TaxID=35783 RepID=UPI00290FC267|nr:hypothetical protein [Enterococcus sp.]MDU5336887.1 hypothetical protein [Enterococcus sp.]
MEELTGYNLPECDYWVKKVLQDEKGTLIVLDSKQFMVKILFAGFVYAMLTADESGLQKRDYEWVRKFGKYLKWGFFKLSNSKFLDFISDQTMGIYDDLDLRHFVVWTEDDSVEIIAHYEPEIEIQEKKLK